MRRCALNTVDHFTLITRSWVATLSLGLSLSRGVQVYTVQYRCTLYSTRSLTAPDLGPDLRGLSLSRGVRLVRADLTLHSLARSLGPGLGHLVTAPDLARHGDQAQVSGTGDMGLVTAVRCAAVWSGGGGGVATREKVIMINITLQQTRKIPSVCMYNWHQIGIKLTITPWIIGSSCIFI